MLLKSELVRENATDEVGGIAHHPIDEERQSESFHGSCSRKKHGRVSVCVKFDTPRDFALFGFSAFRAQAHNHVAQHPPPMRLTILITAKEGKCQITQGLEERHQRVLRTWCKSEELVQRASRTRTGSWVEVRACGPALK